MSKQRLHIPEELQRRVRAHCGFGCAICGEMPTTIEHIFPYSKKEEHIFENLVLLCCKHQQESTSGRLSKETIRTARENPASRRIDSAVYQPTLDKHWEVKLGESIVKAPLGSTVSPFSILGTRPISFHFQESFRVSMNLLDRGGQCCVRMIENTFLFRPSALWDVRLSGSELKVRFGSRVIMISCAIHGGRITINSLRTVVGRVPICIEDGEYRFPGANGRFRGGTFVSKTAADFSVFSFGEDGPNTFFALPESAELSSREEAWEAAIKKRILPRKPKPRFWHG